MLINTPDPINYPDVVDFVRTQKRLQPGTLECKLWIEAKQASAIIEKLQADGIIGPAYIEKASLTPGHTLFYDVVANNNRPQSSPWWQLWGYKLEIAVLFTRFLWITLKNRLAGKKDPLDVVGNATKAVATELQLDYILGIDYQSDGSRHFRVELKEDVEENKAEALTSRLRTEPTLKSYEISRSKNLLKLCPAA